MPPPRTRTELRQLAGTNAAHATFEALDALAGVTPADGVYLREVPRLTPRSALRVIRCARRHRRRPHRRRLAYQAEVRWPTEDSRTARARGILAPILRAKRAIVQR
jgi:hypothetical protein